MSNDEWTNEVCRRGSFSPSVLRKFDQVSLQSFINDLIRWYYTVCSKTRNKPKRLFRSFKLHRNVKKLFVGFSRTTLKNVLEGCVRYHKNIIWTMPTLMAQKVLAPKQEGRVVTQSKAAKARTRFGRPSEINLRNWSPVVRISDRLKPLKRLNTLSVKVTDILKSSKPNICMCVKSNFGCDEIRVKVSQSILTTHPDLLEKKARVDIEDILMRQLGLPPTKEEFMAYLQLQSVNAPTLTNCTEHRVQKFLRSSNTTNLPWSSELGLLLRKPTDVQALIRLERIERFLNSPAVPSTSKTYPVTFRKPPQEDCHTYKFSRKKPQCQSVSSEASSYTNIVRPVRVIVSKAEMEVVNQKLLKLPENCND